MAKKTPSAPKQTFCFAAANAMSVSLVGDFTHWQARPIPMHTGRDGVWMASVELSPGSHTYRFLVDGEWRDDPECTIRVPNPYGGQNMVRRVI